MATELQIIRAQEFIRRGVKGDVDLKASKEMLATLAAACRKRGIDQALLDLREVNIGPKPVFSSKDLIALVNTFREMGFTQEQRLAVLYRSDPHRRARLFTLIANLHGWSVRAFDNYESALTWLSEVKDPRSELEPDTTSKSQRVPVRHQKKASASHLESAPSEVSIRRSHAGNGRVK